MSSRTKKSTKGHAGKSQGNASQGSTNSLKRKQKLKNLLEEGCKIGNVLYVLTINFLIADQFFFCQISGERLENLEAIATLTQVTKIINKTNEIQFNGATSEEGQKNASEVVMDAQVVKMGHELVGSVAQQMGQNEFSEDVYASKVLQLIRNKSSKINWLLLTKQILHVPKRSRFAHSFLGMFDEEIEELVKPKKERPVRQKTLLVEMKRPDKVHKLQKEEKGAQIMNLVYQQIKSEYENRRAPISFYELVVDPEDYMGTVDNAFQIAFLVRDGVIGLVSGEGIEPYIVVTNPEEQSEKRQDAKTVQAITSITVSKWNTMCELYGQKEPILKINRTELLA